MAHLEVTDDRGDVHSGSSFHVGEGWFVTARHVVENHSLSQMTPYVTGTSLEVDGIYFDTNGDTDLALIQTQFPSEKHVRIGGHLDDWFHGEEFVLSEVLLMGYPPVPLSREPFLLATAGEVNAVIDEYIGAHPLFIVSNVARGGFSGGPVISQTGDLFGVMVQSLLGSDSLPAEVGFAAALSVEPLWNLLHQHGVYPASNSTFLRAIYDNDPAAEQELRESPEMEKLLQVADIRKLLDDE